MEGYLDVGSVAGGMHVNQTGDPKKGARTVYEVVLGTGMGVGLEEELGVLLGRNCLGMFGTKVEMMRKTLGGKWRRLRGVRTSRSNRMGFAQDVPGSSSYSSF